VGRGRALELLLSGEPITAAEAHRIGLVNAVVPQPELLNYSRAWLAKVLANAPLAVAMAMETVDVGLDAGIEEGASAVGGMPRLVRYADDFVVLSRYPGTASVRLDRIEAGGMVEAGDQSGQDACGSICGKRKRVWTFWVTHSAGIATGTGATTGICMWGRRRRHCNGSGSKLNGDDRRVISATSRYRN
jgi:hypothetical protein